MKAVVFAEPNRIEISEVPKPEIKEDELLVKVKAVGVCGTDLELLTGDMPHIKNGFTKFPFIPGHEWSGVVEAVGSQVKGFNVGDRVTSDVSIGCGNCHVCKTGRFNICPNRVVIGSYRNKDGAYAEYVTVPYRHAYHLPANISFEEGALVETAATAAYAIKRCRVAFGETVLIFGDGPIGQMAAQFARSSGAARVLMVGSWDEKMRVTQQTAGAITANYKKDDIVQWVQAMTGGEGPDVIVETSGNMKAVNQGIQVLKPGGRIGLVSFYQDMEFMAAVNALIVKDAELIGVLASCNTFKPTLAMMENEIINVKPLITHRFPLEQIEQAFDLIRGKREYRLKIVLLP